jgi:AcrR family transcriptional regulator
MAQPPHVSRESLLAAARQLLEAEGPSGLTMRGLARALGVQAPSLYFHVESRDDLVRELIVHALAELGEALETAEREGGSLSDRARALARAYVSFAAHNPQLFALLFAPCDDIPPLDLSYSEPASAVLLRLAADAAGPDRAIPFGQALWAFVHGFTVLNAAGQFRLTEDASPALELGLAALLAGVRA